MVSQDEDLIRRVNIYVDLGLVHFVTKEFSSESPACMKLLELLAQAAQSARACS